MILFKNSYGKKELQMLKSNGGSYMKHRTWSRSVASVAICAAGAYCMYVTNSSTGIGWTCLGLCIIWS